MDDLLQRLRGMPSVMAMRDAATVIERLRAENEVLRGDAELYRWLRREIKSPTGRLVIASVSEFGDLTSWSGDDPDGAIHAARQKEKNDNAMQETK